MDDRKNRVGIRELKTHASEILRRVRERQETIAITHRGEVIARLEPVRPAPRVEEDLTNYWAEFDQLVEDIAAKMTGPVNVVDVMREMRRDL
jgi:prevent-host-death family protein